MWRKVLGVIATLFLLAAASWLPAHAVQTAAAPSPAAPQPGAAAALVDLARPALAVPSALPVRATSPQEVVRAYLFTLSRAANVEGARIAGGDAPYAAAYAYLDTAWRARLPFARFVSSWEQVAHLDVLQVVDAGPVPYNAAARRVFAEVREYLILPERQTVGFAAGVFTALQGHEGWYLTDGTLKPEEVATSPFGGQGAWRRDPAAVARAQIAADLKLAPRVARVERNGHLAVVEVVIPSEPGSASKSSRVHLAELVDATWAPLYVEK